MRVSIIGAGLAGSEAAWRLARDGFEVLLYEMKPKKYSPAHQFPGFAELVCSNSLKAERLESASGLLKAEMRLLGSLTLEAADAARVPAGGALAVDREAFSNYVTRKLRELPNVTVLTLEAASVPEGEVVAATGPLTAGRFAKSVQELCGEPLSFYDAAAPIVSADSIDHSKVFYAARYDRGEADYLNCPMDREQYLAFWEALRTAETAPLHGFDRRKVYEGCMPVEVLASRGEDSIRYGPLKPVGLRDPATGRRPYAVVQLRRENLSGGAYNLVGFQTNLRFPEQKRVFSMIPGLEQAEFLRYGVMHRNTFLNGPELLDGRFRLKKEPRICFAGQMTGVEGYMESAMTGQVCAFHLSRKLRGLPEAPLPPAETLCGAFSRYVSEPNDAYQPMGSSMGLLPPLAEPVKGKQERYRAIAERSLRAMKEYLAEYSS